MSGPIERIANRVKQYLGLARIDSVSDANELQLVKITGLADEEQSNLERIQDYGITSNPPVGSEAVVLYVGGNKDHGVVIKTDSGEFRIQPLESGEVCIYSQHGQKILLDENGDIVFNDGTDFMVRFNELKTGFDQLVSDFNAHAHGGSVDSLAGPCTILPPTTAVPPDSSSASIDSAKIEEIKIP
jgi:phage baseplate assembly protein V